MSVLAAAAVAVGAAAQAVTGLGFALIGGPLLVLLLGPVPGVRTIVLLSLVLNLAILVREWRRTDVRAALAVLIPALLVTPFVAAAVRRLDGDVATAAAGVATLAGVAALAWGVRWRAASGRTGGVVAGAVSATMNVVAGIGGPAVVLYATNAGWPVDRLRPTLQVYFAGLNLVTLASIGLPRWGASSVAVAAALGGGFAVGAVLAGRLPDRWGRRLTLALAGLGGVAALVRGLG